MNTCTMRVLSSFTLMPSECEAIPHLGDSQYTDQDQLSNPDKQMTRVVKDVLRVGRWKVGYKSGNNGKIEPIFWEVTHDVLDGIAENFQLQKANGVHHPLCWGHIQEGKPDIDPRETICQIDDAMHVDGTLWVACYVNPVEATILQNRKRQVSIGAIQDLEDGEGRVYPGGSLAHVAIVEHPVVPGQKGFIQLSLSSEKKHEAFKKPQGTIQMAFTLENWTRALNSFLPDGSDIPLEGDGAITEENADEMLALVMSLTGNGDVTEEAPEGDGTGSPDSEVIPDAGDVPALEEMPVEMRNKIKSDPALLGLFNHFNGKLGKAQTQLSLMQAQDRKTKQEAFLNRLKEMGKAGLDAVTIAELQQLGKGQSYQLSLLKPYEKLCDASLMGNHTKQLGNSQPNNPGVKKTRTEEEIKRLADSIR